MPTLTLGTFNVNNLFSRFNFRGELPAAKKGQPAVRSSVTFDLRDPSSFALRTYRGGLVQGKPVAERQIIARRIKDMDADVLAVQEVEDIDTLRRFNRDDLGRMYPFVVLVEGNDPRLIDVGVLSKYPIGAVVSWQHARHPADLSEPVFSRDLLQVEVLNKQRTGVLFTLLNTHLKSHLVLGRDRAKGIKEANERRRRQAEMIGLLAQHRLPGAAKYAIVGDMNDPPDSPFLAPFAGAGALGLVNALKSPKETQPAKADTSPPKTKAWTHRFKESGKPVRYELYDHIWLSPALAGGLKDAWIGRRSKHGGDGSDHDPAWVELDV
jgi:endonuclease/exonuclease/phosphatase family metal-dependent hydrolase